MKVKSDSSGRGFGHCKFTWEIRNYKNLVWKEKAETESARFAVHGPGSLITDWKLILEHDFGRDRSRLRTKLIPEFQSTQMGNNNPKHVRFFMYLERSDSGQNSVCVDWRVVCVRNGSEQAIDVGEQYFDKSGKHGFDLGVVIDFEREFQSSDPLVFECRMIVHQRCVPHTPLYAVDTNLRNLSQDLRAMLKHEKFSDLKLKLGDNCVNVHKCVIFSRCGSLKDELKENEEIYVPASVARYDGLVRVLDYVYSGDISDVACKPSISVYDSIVFLSLEELQEYYAPEKYKVGTEIAGQELTYVWCVMDFSIRDEYCLSSPIIGNSTIDTTWQIHLYPKGITNQSEDVSISVENTEGNICPDLCIQCAVLKKGEPFHSWKTLQKSTEEKFFEIGEIMKRDALIESIDDDELRLGFRVKMYTGNVHTVLRISQETGIKREDIKLFEKLSSDMALLQSSDMYTDITLKVENKEIRAHKCILAARSRVLSDLIQKMEGDSLALSNIKPGILKVLLDSMYSATLEVSDTVTVLDVYRAAEELAVCCVREECSRILRDGLELGTVCEVLDFADDCRDNLLKQKATEFMQANIIDVRKCKLWDDLRNKKPFLCEEIDKCSASIEKTEDLEILPSIKKPAVEEILLSIKKPSIEEILLSIKKPSIEEILLSIKPAVEEIPISIENNMIEGVPSPAPKDYDEQIPKSTENSASEEVPLPIEKAAAKEIPASTENVSVEEVSATTQKAEIGD